MSSTDGLPKNVKNYIAKFENSLSEEEFNSERFAYRVYLFRKIANHKGQADKVVEFIPPESELAKEVERVLLAVKDRERPKFKPKSVWEMMQAEGFVKFKQHQHTELWKRLDAKNPGKGLGTEVEGQWYWYEPWLEIVRKHCQDVGDLYR